MTSFLSHPSVRAVVRESAAAAHSRNEIMDIMSNAPGQHPAEPRYAKRAEGMKASEIRETPFETGRCGSEAEVVGFTN